MKKILLSVLLFSSLTTYGQNGITFSVEKLSHPQDILKEESDKAIWEKLIILSASTDRDSVDKKKMPEVPFNIIAQSKTPSSMVYLGSNPFFSGMYKAYAQHRPFVLSPDMVWLLIEQGFARHVNANGEKMRHYFVQHSGKLSLVVSGNGMNLNDPNIHWEEIFPQFTKQIGAFTGDELMNLLSADFSTTTSIEKVASQITIMEAMKPYFNFIVSFAGCGIPEITLTGTPEDWQKVLSKTKQLSQYDLQWWTQELEPLLKEFVRASKGHVNKHFWRRMFRYHTKKVYGNPRIIDGWIVKFFPYDKEGKRNDLKKLIRTDKLPEEMVKVDMQCLEEGGKTTPLELWAGFVGVEQNRENFTLKPIIGWMIRKKDMKYEIIKQKLEEENSGLLGIEIKVSEVPDAILEMKEIERLAIDFMNQIIIPDKLGKVKIKTMYLIGKTNEEEIKRIKALFPNTELWINRELIK